jgi:xanthine dehydrogenase YagT iron-sulfur-binding subunit
MIDHSRSSEGEPIAADDSGPSRRQFLGQLAALSAGLTVAGPLSARAEIEPENVVPKLRARTQEKTPPLDIVLKVNGKSYRQQLDPRVTLLDALRERLDLPGTKKGCDHGACGACTVLVEGRRVLSCLTLAAIANGKEVTTIEGLAKGDELHPVQAAFIACDSFQCGYCTPGQIMSAVGCIQEGHVSTDADIREYMSGNLCRCGAYPNIVEAIKLAAPKTKGV